MHKLPKSVQKLIDQFVMLPGIGPKSASRLVLYLLHSSDLYVSELLESLKEIKLNVKFCKKCFNLSEGNLCSICEDDTRNSEKILIIEDVLDLIAFESMGEYTGLYHVLGGVISPIQGIGPDDLTINSLEKRLKEGQGRIKEIIIATNPNLEGEATASYLNSIIINIDNKIEVTRIARGLPTGADLDYADKVTLLKSLQGRSKIV